MLFDSRVILEPSRRVRSPRPLSLVLIEAATGRLTARFASIHDEPASGRHSTPGWTASRMATGPPTAVGDGAGLVGEDRRAVGFSGAPRKDGSEDTGRRTIRIAMRRPMKFVLKINFEALFTQVSAALCNFK